MKLTYTPKPGYESVVPGWPASDHTEPDAKLAAAKVASGFYRATGSKSSSAKKGAADTGDADEGK